MTSEDRSGSAQSDEFETYARWTREAVVTIGPDVAVPAACRGSGGRQTLDWLLERIAPRSGEFMLDLGGGMGGPAAYAGDRTKARVVVIEPSAEACRSARELFGLGAVRASADRLPVTTRGARVAWSLGVLCTVQDQQLMLAEAARVLRPGGVLGLRVLVRARTSSLPAPDGNHFPTRVELGGLLQRARLSLLDVVLDDELPGPGSGWEQAGDRVEQLIRTRHGEDPAYGVAQEQAGRIADLVDAGDVQATTITCSA